MTKKISIFAFCGAVLALLLWVFCGPDVAAEAVYPVENGSNWFSRKVLRRFKAVFAAGSALVENDSLRAEAAKLRMACADADRIAAENARLRKMLGLDESGATTQFGTNAWLCAPIISRGAAVGNPCLLRLGRGFLSGVKPGAVVAVPEGLVGRIGNVTPNTSELRLITDPSMRVSCDIELEVPDLMQGLRVDTEEALRYARENNPRYMESRQATEEARRDAAKARVEKNLNLSLDVSVGLNQVAYRFVDAYMHPLLQDVAMVTLSVPIVDWGKRKNAYMAALSKVEAAERSEQEAARDTELDVMLTVNDFNEQQTIVEASQEALNIAEDAYNQTLLRFIKAQANTTDLSLAQTNWLTAQQNKIASLQNYWITYYRLRRLTLYDYQQRQVIRYVRK